MKKEDYIKIVDEKLFDSSKKIMIEQINKFYEAKSYKLDKHKYEVGDDVKLLKDTVKDRCFVKAAGGVRSHDDFLKMIELGADRIGTSSGIKLIEE